MDIYYFIKKVGEYAVPSNPYLVLDTNGYGWGCSSSAHKFLCLDSAQYILEDVQARGEKVFLEWRDDSPNPKHGAFGEVNPYAYQK